MNPPLTVDLQGAADMMKVHPKTVLDLIGAGVLPAARIGRAYVLLTKDVLIHIEREIIRQTAARMRSPISAGAQRALDSLGSGVAVAQVGIPAQVPLRPRRGRGAGKRRGIG